VGSEHVGTENLAVVPSADLKEINLGPEGREYVATCLRQGTGLCSKLLKVLDRAGHAFAPLPVTLSPERTKQFETGGMMSRRAAYLWFGHHIETLSQHTPDSSLVFQDVWAKPKNFAVTPGDVNLFFDATNAYYLLGAHEMTTSNVLQVTRQITSFLMVAAFCDFPFCLEDLPPTHVAAEALIDEIENNTQEIFVSAYDQEGLVVWRAADLKSRTTDYSS
jgi:hypothetical protein